MAVCAVNPDICAMAGTPPKTLDRTRLRLLELTQLPGAKSLETLSKELGMNSGYLRDFITKGSPKKLDGDIRRPLAVLLGISEVELGGDPQPTAQRTVSVTEPPLGPQLETILRPAGPLLPGARDVPILGYAKGGNDAFFIDQGVRIGMAYRPAILEGIQDAFAVEVVDNSMHPALKHGHIALIHPRKMALPGDEVLVTLKDGQAFLKELVRRTEKTLLLRQHNPPKEVPIPMKDVANVQLVVDSPRVRV